MDQKLRQDDLDICHYSQAQKVSLACLYVLDDKQYLIQE